MKKPKKPKKPLKHAQPPSKVERCEKCVWENSSSDLSLTYGKKYLLLDEAEEEKENMRLAEFFAREEGFTSCFEEAVEEILRDSHPLSEVCSNLSCDDCISEDFIETVKSLLPKGYSDLEFRHAVSDYPGYITYNVEKDKKQYQKELDEYNNRFKAYEKALQVYEAEMKKYEEYKKQEKIANLQKQIKELST